MYRFFNNLIVGIKNIIHYLPVIWNDRQWDHSYIIVLLHKKFELMLQHMNSDDCVRSVNQDKYIKQVNICKNLCKRIISHNYLTNALTRHHELYGDDLRVTFKEVEDHPGFKKIVFQEEPYESKSFLRAGKHSDYMIDQDYDLLFKMMNKYIKYWWD